MHGSTGPSFLSPAFVGQPLHINEEQLSTLGVASCTEQDTAESHCFCAFIPTDQLMRF